MASGMGPGFGPPPPSARGTSNRGWYIATAVVAVLVIAVVSILVATSGSGGGTASSSDCQDRQADDKGFSECMRRLAGAVAEKNDCQKGAINPLGGETMETPGATTASCTMADDYTVMYLHFGKSEKADGSEQSGADTAKQYMDTIKQQFKNLETAGGDPEEGGWDGDGLSGTYYSIDLGFGSGVLVFQVNDSPVAGVLMRISTDTTSSGAKMSEFFDKHVKPGSDGGA